eukprot:TRINITY_DN1556_c0_g2_i2.p2 TRINITY_DN1556_c0_g2~~TRINITY_DN1556_c0_g2_i2.p2  ORF type:complete len:158 (-),score=50.98 TRINITY_DN1556_c0_g2_i2:685-1158(-)
MFFFSLQDKGQFEKVRRAVEKTVAPRNLTEIKHFDGKISVDVTAEKVSAGKSLQTFSSNAQALLEKAIRANEDTVRVMQILITAFEREAEAYKELAQAYASVESVEIADIFNSVRLLMDGQAKLIQNQSTSLHKSLGNYYSYYRDEVDVLKKVRILQ